MAVFEVLSKLKLWTFMERLSTGRDGCALVVNFVEFEGVWLCLG